MKKSLITRKRILKSSEFVPGTKKRDGLEKQIAQINFDVHKFTVRPTPRNINDVVIFPIFSEFGTEMLAPLYCIPKLMRTKYAGKYSVVAGWFGRSYLYKHLVDEFWEIGEEFQHLREYCRAFHHDSRNLIQAQEEMSQYGKVVSIEEISNIAVYPALTQCPVQINRLLCKGQVISCDNTQTCTKCGTFFPAAGLFSDTQHYKRKAVWVPMPSQNKLNKANQLIKSRSVGIVARGRKCYGRNLETQFYERLIHLIEGLGYNVVWLGEKATTLPCPCPHVFDYSRTEESRDLELTLAIVSKLAFTVQFWTASTRIAGLVGTPFLLFESPDQIWGSGQEGFRLNLCSKGPKKIVAAHFLNVLNDNDTALQIIQQAVSEMENGDYRTLVGQVQNKELVTRLILDHNQRVGF